MRICVLASGSKGNSTYVETENSKILIDAGLSKTELERRLSLINVNPFDIDAILVTHEHSDHIKGLSQFVKKYNNKIYAHRKSWDILAEKLGDISTSLQIEFNGEDFNIKDMTIQSFDLEHDSAHCVGFSVIEGRKKFSTATDLGHTSPEIISHLKTSDFVILEANHDIQTLRNNPNYPYYLKSRILSNHGHLSNDETAKTIIKLLGNTTRGVMLAHLSEQNNSPQLATQTIRKTLIENNVSPAEELFIDIAKQENVSNIFKIKE